ncbi:hypothetical protein [Bradyrhizobium cenepequi]
MSLADQSKTYLDVQDVIRRSTEFFLETGVAWHQKPNTVGLTYTERRRLYRQQIALLGEGFMRAYLRGVAKELKRPFLHANTNFYPAPGGRLDDVEAHVEVTELTIPKMKRLQNVAMALFIGADEYPRAPYRHGGGAAHPTLARWESGTS